MTNRTAGKQRARKPVKTRRHPLLLPGAIAAALAVAVVVVATTGGSDPGGSPSASPRELNEMGLPVVPTPGSASGTASAGGVEVTGARWEMGRVPLEVAVRPSWTLVNTSQTTVLLGEPHPEIRAGCCPGPFTIGRTELAPGESTTLTFELSMHPGMEGWHDIAVHVPVSSGVGSERLLELVVTGDFRGMPQA